MDTFWENGHLVFCGTSPLSWRTLALNYNLEPETAELFLRTVMLPSISSVFLDCGINLPFFCCFVLPWKSVLVQVISNNLVKHCRVLRACKPWQPPHTQLSRQRSRTQHMLQMLTRTDFIPLVSLSDGVRGHFSFAATVFSLFFLKKCFIDAATNFQLCHTFFKCSYSFNVW